MDDRAIVDDALLVDRGDMRGAAVTRRELVFAVGQTLAAFVALASVVALLAHAFHLELRHGAELLLDALGLEGIALGTFLADGFHVPVAPQLYMLAVVARGAPPVPALLAIGLGTIVGGHVGYVIARRLARWSFIRRGVDRVAVRLEPWLARFGMRALVIAALLPVPYSFLCYFAGLHRVPYRMFVPVVVLRIPKIVVYFLLVRAGWSR